MIKDFNAYTELAKRTDNSVEKEDAINSLVNGAMGLSGEAGEVLDHMKKVRFQGHKLEDHQAKIKEELGDVMWYMAKLCRELEIDFWDMLEQNIRKLEKRYPNLRFEAEQSINRQI